ncbi:hypothetical protein [Paludifilum halophilum]|uniref:hypothetical protein n=1 Tax=Paludifilum halophilum TaxID=1642702 RepID=UPI00113FE9BA|nr:hypothetical protein [Paludifilum halophilum]
MRFGWLVMTICLLVTGTGCGFTVADPPATDQTPLRQVWLIHAYGLTFKDLRDGEYPHLSRMLRQSAIGAMNRKTGGKETVANSLATLGSGTRARVFGEEGFYLEKEWVNSEGIMAKALHEQRTGTAPPEGSVIYPDIMEYIRENEDGPYHVVPGALGEALRRSGRSRLVLGNMDEGNHRPVRYAPFLTMDRRGWTEEGWIGKQTLTESPRRPFGVKTRYGWLEKHLFHWPRPGLAVVDLGDLYRLEQAESRMSSRYREVVRSRVLSEMDRFVGKAMRKVPDDTMLALVSTSGDQAQDHGEELLPVMLYRKGEAPGLLTSDTTRRRGIVSNIDLAPTLLTILGVETPKTMMGRSMKRTEGSPADFWRTLDRAEAVYRFRPPVMYSYILFQMAVLVAGSVLLLTGSRQAGGWMQAVALAIMLTPFVFLLTSGISAESPLSLAAFLLLTVFILAGLFRRLDTIPLFFWVGLISFLPIVLDGILGGPFIRQSFLGYDAIKGARYYGVGNEYMGVILGSSILTCAAWLEGKNRASRILRSAVALFFLGLAIFFAVPFLGANAGGALASAVGFGVAFIRFFRVGKSFPVWQGLGLIILGFSLLFFFNGIFSFGFPTHIDRAFSHLQAGDWGEILRILHRKGAMNWKLIRISSWGKVFLLSLGVMAVLAFRPVGGLKKLRMSYPQLFNGFIAILSGALTALAVNDSGIVSAATAIIYIVMPVMVIGFREWVNENPVSGGRP